MKNYSILVERFINELELRNYSRTSIKTYTELLCVLENKINEDLSNVSVEDFKKFLHLKMMVEKEDLREQIYKKICELTILQYKKDTYDIEAMEVDTNLPNEVE